MRWIQYCAVLGVLFVGINLYSGFAEFKNDGCFEEEENAETLVCRRRYYLNEPYRPYKAEKIRFKQEKDKWGDLLFVSLWMIWDIDKNVLPHAVKAGIGFFHVERFCDQVKESLARLLPHNQSHGTFTCVLNALDNVSLKFAIDAHNKQRVFQDHRLNEVQEQLLDGSIYCVIDPEFEWHCLLSEIRVLSDKMSQDIQKSILIGFAQFLNGLLGRQEVPDSVTVSGKDSMTVLSPSRKFYIKSVFSGKCIDVKDNSLEDRAPIHVWECLKIKNQEVTLKPTNLPDVFTVVFAHSGKCLDVENNGDHNAARLIQWPCHGGVNQRFQFSRDYKKVPLDTYKFLIQTFNGKCLDVGGWNENNGAQLQQWECTTWENQLFILQPVY